LPAESADLAGVKDGGFAERGGALVVRNGDRLEPANLPPRQPRASGAC
jgi:hypothetical protein